MTQKIVSRGLIIVVLCALLGYAYFEARPYLSGPQLTITTPQSGFVLDENPLLVSGTAQRISHITLNGRPIFVNESGVFEETVLLSPGYSVIEITVTDRYERTKTIRVLGTYTPPPVPIVDSEMPTATSSPDADTVEPTDTLDPAANF